MGDPVADPIDWARYPLDFTDMNPAQDSLVDVLIENRGADLLDFLERYEQQVGEFPTVHEFARFLAALMDPAADEMPEEDHPDPVFLMPPQTLFQLIHNQLGHFDPTSVAIEWEDERRVDPQNEMNSTVGRFTEEGLYVASRVYSNEQWRTMRAFHAHGPPHFQLGDYYEASIQFMREVANLGVSGIRQRQQTLEWASIIRLEEN